MKITPREGDYTKVALLNNEQYHAIAKIFIDAGANEGEYPFGSWDKWVFIGWRSDGRFTHQDSISYFPGRELSLSDLLGDDEAVWNDEGLPPVGQELEYLWNGNTWRKASIIAHAKEGDTVHAIVQIDGNWGFCSKPERFRPLKSERELAIEEMVKVVSHYPHDSQAVTQICGQLYDAGYRKTKDAEK